MIQNINDENWLELTLEYLENYYSLMYANGNSKLADNVDKLMTYIRKTN